MISHLWGNILQICLLLNIYLIVLHRMHWNWNPGFMDPSKEWSQTRLHLRQAIGPQVMPGYRPFIYNGVTQLIRTLIDFEGDPAAKIGV